MLVHLALRRRAAMSTVVIGAIALLLAVPQDGRADLRQAPSALPQMWGMAIDGRTFGMLDRKVLTRLRAAGITLVADRASLSARQRGRLARLAARTGLRVFAPGAASHAARANARCLARKRSVAGRRCAVRTDRRRLSRQLAHGRVMDIVVVRARGAREFAGLDDEARWTRVLGVLDLSTRSLRGGRWRRAVRAANRSPLLDLVVRPRGAGKRRALLRMLGRLERQAARDRTPPRKPRGPAAAALDGSSASVSWQALRRVAGYGVYRDGAYQGRSRRAKVRFDRLTCAGHLVEIDAIDRRGNRSAKGFVNASPSGCDSGSPGDRAIPEPPPTVFVSPTGSDEGSCTRAAPCATFDRGYREAGPGEVVEVAGGRYPAQTFTSDGRTAGPNAIFRPAPGARVILAGLDFGSGGEAGTRARLHHRAGDGDDLQAAPSRAPATRRACLVGPGSSHIRLERMDAGSVTSWFADNLTVAGGDIRAVRRRLASADAVCGNTKSTSPPTS